MIVFHATVTKSNNVTIGNPHETQKEIEMLRQELNFKNQTISNLENQLQTTTKDKEDRKQQAEKITLLLTDQSNKPHISTIESVKSFFGGLGHKK